MIGKPYGIFINTRDDIYVADYDRHCVVFWLKDDRVNSKKICVGNNPYSVFVMNNGDIYTEDSNRQVKQYVLNESSPKKTIPSEERCFGLFIDIDNTLYCSIEPHHVVKKVSLNDNTGNWTIVAGSINKTGPQPDQLQQPHGIFVHINFDLYVADYGNNRIQLFKHGNPSGITVVGTELIENKPLNHPTAIILDFDGNLFIVDHDNYRIVRSGPEGFECLVGCSSKGGSEAHQMIRPYALAFDSQGNIFVTDRDNKRIQKFILASNSCGTYYKMPR